MQLLNLLLLWFYFVIKVLWARVNHHIYLYVLLIQSLRLPIRTKRTKMLGSVGPGK